MGLGRRDERKKARILIVDDHPMMRERLREVIEGETDMSVCGEADAKAPAMEQIGQQRPDLVLVDLMLKDSSGLDLIREAHGLYPELPMLVISMHEEALYAERVLRAGARGFVNKQEPTPKMLVAMRTVLGGSIYLSVEQFASVTAKLSAQVRGHDRVGIGALTDRELSVFELLGRGCATREIGRQLGLEIRTVETYRARIKQKLRLRNAHELLLCAIRWVEEGQKPPQAGGPESATRSGAHRSSDR